jgi:nitrite reductase (NADH) small subunit
MEAIKIRIARSTDIPEGESRIFTLPDGDEVAIFHHQGSFYAVQNLCPHQGGPLGDGEVDDHCVTCPWHGWKFDLRTGTCVTGGDDCKTFKVEEEAGALYLKIPTPDLE